MAICVVFAACEEDILILKTTKGHSKDTVMNFQPRTEKEIADNRLLPKGEYDFEILDAWEKKSSAGNDMIELKVRVSNGDGVSRTLADYLVAKRAEKLLHCCRACGLVEKYDTGCLSGDDFPGKRGRLKLAVEKSKKGYPDKNVIADYLVTTLPAA